MRMVGEFFEDFEIWKGDERLRQIPLLLYTHESARLAACGSRRVQLIVGDDTLHGG